MKLTATVKLLPTPEQATLLKDTLERANAACNWISQQAWQQRVFGQIALHRLTYYAARERFGLGAQVIVRCIANDVNHCISKQLVKNAQGTRRGIGLEDLTHIRQRITARKHKRAELHGWSFADLTAKIDYKAQRYGVPVEYVDPRNTSRRCSVCGHVDKASRQSQSRFLCTACGHATQADCNAALNIRVKANAQWSGRSVNPPNEAQAST